MQGRENIIVGLDIGTTKICAVVGEASNDDINIIGIGTSPSIGLRKGVVVKGQRTAPAQVERLEKVPDLPPRPVPVRFRKNVPTAWLRLVLTEGRKRQVRHMTAAVGHPTLRLIRVGIGPLELGEMQPGEWRELTPGDLEALRAVVRSPARR